MGYSDVVPHELLDPGKKLQFLNWLAKLPADPWTKVRILFYWARATNSTITEDDVEYVTLGQAELTRDKG